ncbi:hypothetical protein ACOSQ4_016440 [Xanthoceras sorbifolium]
MENQKYRILMVSDFFYPNFGGVENHIYYLDLKPSHPTNNITGGLKVYYIPWRPFLLYNTLPTFYRTFPIIRTILIREKTLKHARTMGSKVVFTDHSLWFCYVGSIHMNKVLQFTLADVSQAICVSHTSKENTVLHSGLPPEKVFVIPNAMDTAMLKPAPMQLDRNEIIIDVISKPGGGPGRSDIVSGHQFPWATIVNSFEHSVYYMGLSFSWFSRPHTFFLPRAPKIFGPALVISRLVYRKGADLLVEVITEVCRIYPNESSCISDCSSRNFTKSFKPMVLGHGRVDPQVMHDRMKKLYNWHDVAKRTKSVYDRALKCSNQNLLDCTSHAVHHAWAGKLFALVMIIDYCAVTEAILLRLWLYRTSFNMNCIELINVKVVCRNKILQVVGLFECKPMY